MSTHTLQTVISVSGTEALVKIVWNKTHNGWGGILVTTGEQGKVKRPIHEGTDIDMEVTENRRCVGYIDETGRKPCPTFAELESRRQCYPCRNNDIYVDYVEGRSGQTREGAHSVYLAQAGGQLKVGITRSSRLMRRWVEQGAIYATEISRCESADDALALESTLSEAGFSERLGKIGKSKQVREHSRPIQHALEQTEFDGEIVDVQSRTMYTHSPVEEPAQRTGKFRGEIRSARGQLLHLDGQCLAVMTGRCIREPIQRSIGDF